jgi:cardiolipin synthase
VSCQGASAGTSTGVNILPGSDDDGWIIPNRVSLADRTTVQLYKDGEALHAAYNAVAAARRRVCLQVYTFYSDATGRSFAELLSARARAGVEVRFLYDSFGSAGTDPSLFSRMRAAGVHVLEFHPWNPLTLTRGWHVFYRDHRKMLVVDDEVAGLGGLNVSDEYGGSWVSGEPYCDPWRDTGVGLSGPSVGVFEAAFERSWRYAGRGGSIRQMESIQGGRPCRTDGQPYASRARPRSAHRETSDGSVTLIGSIPRSDGPLLKTFLRLLAHAQSSVDVTMAYFAPPAAILEAHMQGARRGARVRLMLPGRSDVPLLQVAARGCYDALISAGVEVYERQGAVLHSKTLSVDGYISVIGSANFDYRSFRFNYELAAIFRSRSFAVDLRKLFEHDMEYSRRIGLKEWRQRPMRQRLAQRVAIGARYLL